MGKLIEARLVKNRIENFDLNFLPNGIYSLLLRDNSNKQIWTDKIIVTK